MLKNQLPASGAPSKKRIDAYYFGVLPPLILLVGALLALLIYIAFWLRQGSLDFFMFYALASLPHFATLIILFNGSPPRKTFAIGFLCGFWASFAAYLLFLGIFIFSAEYLKRNQEAAWYVAFAFSVWVALGSLLSKGRDKSSFEMGSVIGVIYPIGAMIWIAMVQRAHH